MHNFVLFISFVCLDFVNFVFICLQPDFVTAQKQLVPFTPLEPEKARKEPSETKGDEKKEDSVTVTVLGGPVDGPEANISCKPSFAHFGLPKFQDEAPVVATYSRGEGALSHSAAREWEKPVQSGVPGGKHTPPDSTSSTLDDWDGPQTLQPYWETSQGTHAAGPPPRLVPFHLEPFRSQELPPVQVARHEAPTPPRDIRSPQLAPQSSPDAAVSSSSAPHENPEKPSTLSKKMKRMKRTFSSKKGKKASSSWVSGSPSMKNSPPALKSTRKKFLPVNAETGDDTSNSSDDFVKEEQSSSDTGRNKSPVTNKETFPILRAVLANPASTSSVQQAAPDKSETEGEISWRDEDPVVRGSERDSGPFADANEVSSLETLAEVALSTSHHYSKKKYVCSLKTLAEVALSTSGVFFPDSDLNESSDETRESDPNESSNEAREESPVREIPHFDSLTESGDGKLL